MCLHFRVWSCNFFCCNSDKTILYSLPPKDGVLITFTWFHKGLSSKSNLCDFCGLKVTFCFPLIDDDDIVSNKTSMGQKEKILLVEEVY